VEHRLNGLAHISQEFAVRGLHGGDDFCPVCLIIIAPFLLKGVVRQMRLAAGGVVAEVRFRVCGDTRGAAAHDKGPCGDSLGLECIVRKGSRYFRGHHTRQPFGQGHGFDRAVRQDGEGISVICGARGSRGYLWVRPGFPGRLPRRGQRQRQSEGYDECDDCKCHCQLHGMRLR
jgi:hypothetical protein